MKRSDKAGFTIIEVMLFVAISGMLALIVLAGTSTAINSQRYRDSVTSLQSFLQQQYFEVANVNNSPRSVDVPGCLGGRGQTECMMLGRLISTVESPDGKTFTIKNIVGGPDPSIDATDDVDALRNYGVHFADPTGNNGTYDVEWGSSIVKSSDGTSPMKLSILMLRSPLSGVIRTFVSSSTTTPAFDTFLSSSNFVEAKMCVNSNGLFSGKKMAVVIDANATGSNGVETLGDDSGCN